MDPTGSRSDRDVPVLAGVTLGRTTIGSKASPDLLAYVVRAEAIVYVDPPQLARIAAALGATTGGAHLAVRRGRPFRDDARVALECAIRPLSDLPATQPVGMGDGLVVQGHECVLIAPFSCCILSPEDGSPAFSFKAPHYGLSWCGVAPGGTCVSWVAEEECETYWLLNCQPEPGVRRKIAAWVCSMP